MPNNIEVRLANQFKGMDARIRLPYYINKSNSLLESGKSYQAYYLYHKIKEIYKYAPKDVKIKNTEKCMELFEKLRKNREKK